MFIDKATRAQLLEQVFDCTAELVRRESAADLPDTFGTFAPGTGAQLVSETGYAVALADDALFWLTDLGTKEEALAYIAEHGYTLEDNE